MKTISFILPSTDRSGGIKATVQLANLLLNRNYIVKILVKRNNPFNIKDIARGFYLKKKYSGAVDWLDEFKGTVYYYNNNLSEHSFKKGEYIIFVGLETIDEIGYITSEEVKKFLFIHGLTPSRHDLMEKAIILNIPKLFVSSYLENIFSHTKIDNFSTVIPNGVDLKEYYPVFPEKERIGIGTVYSGAISKDPGTIINVINILKSKFTDIPIYTFGSWKKPNNLKYAKYVRLPSINESRDIYSKCRVWFVASKTEGFSLPILEAMACGCAVVSTKCGGPSDIINNGENGYLVDIGDAEGLAEKIFEIYYDNEKFKMIENNAFNTVKKFTCENSANIFEEALKNIKDHNRL